MHWYKIMEHPSGINLKKQNQQLLITTANIHPKTSNMQGMPCNIRIEQSFIFRGEVTVEAGQLRKQTILIIFLLISRKVLRNLIFYLKCSNQPQGHKNSKIVKMEVQMEAVHKILEVLKLVGESTTSIMNPAIKSSLCKRKRLVLQVFSQSNCLVRVVLGKYTQSRKSLTIYNTQ